MPIKQVITGEDVSLEEQALRYELAVLSYRLPDAAAAKAGVEPWVGAPDARGRLLGCWEAEHGTLGRLYLLRGFVDDADLAAERARAAASTDPFGAGGHLTDLRMNSFAAFPFMPPVVTGSFGSIYEIRDYHLRPGGLPATIAAWRERLPGRQRVDPIAVVMYALDGPARIVHIWPFESLDQRVAVRRDLYERGLWPPPGALEQILDAESTMAWPAPFSPLT
ncbi:NIPSNAP family containing protein [Frankia canadensis]|uniref:NIPSNAP family containing protein n=1 Tax=Frankia canadensis TaxID=1836972 RepID=A0A2I2L191_9ACTN|nr:NIPSNAP family protein [Frankia canadensis]SNQ51678.1 NIPSNAP family containing protein [Frankia canadensis]SOU58968.1 NIPSNAP family containing protein [Frankia canadensis]